MCGTNRATSFVINLSDSRKEIPHPVLPITQDPITTHPFLNLANGAYGFRYKQNYKYII